MKPGLAAARREDSAVEVQEAMMGSSQLLQDRGGMSAGEGDRRNVLPGCQVLTLGLPCEKENCENSYKKQAIWYHSVLENNEIPRDRPWLLIKMSGFSMWMKASSITPFFLQTKYGTWSLGNMTEGLRTAPITSLALAEGGRCFYTLRHEKLSLRNP